MTASIDGFTSATLKDLRERWWTADFTEFLAETLRPRPGNRILDVGCGEGLAEVSLGHLHISQIRLVGIDLAGLPEGSYDLVLDVRDEISSARLRQREPFTIEGS